MWRWLLVPEGDRSEDEIIGWWEIRRIPYNIVVGLAGAGSLVATFFLIIASGILKPGEDAIEPIAMMAAPVVGAIFFNICYTAGWAVELYVRENFQDYPANIGTLLFVAGLLLSLAIVLLPTVFWGTFVVVT